MRIPERLIGVAFLIVAFLTFKYWVPSAGPPGWRKLEKVANASGLDRLWRLFLVVRRWFIVAWAVGVAIGGILWLVVPPAQIH